ncbi:MAG: insulinase family protein [Deltaproteobacteria bacterium]|nr:insulinase family protein [Deltaproteobacteria bacterium]
MHKKNTDFCYLALIIILFLPACSGTIPVRPQMVRSEPLTIQIKEPMKYVLPNGLTIYYQQNEELPLMRGVLLIPGGKLLESENLLGLAAATGSQMRSGGTKDLRPEELDRRLDALGAVVESSYGEDFGTVGFSCLSENFTEVFNLFGQVVLQPRFDEQRFGLWKAQAIDSVLRRSDDSETMAAMTFSLAIYGNSAYGRAADIAAIKKLKVKDLKEFHQHFVFPQGARLAISGSVPWPEIKQEIEDNFASWTKSSLPKVELPPLNKEMKPGVYILRKDFTQAQIVIGHQGPPRITDDLHAMAIFNSVFGLSGFDSFLFKQVRSQGGYAYAVFGGIFGGPTAGTFQVQMATRNEEAINAIDKVLEIVKGNWGKRLEEGPIAATKHSLKQSFVFKFENPAERAKRKALLDQFGYPEDFDRNYLTMIDKVTAEDTAAVSKRWIQPENISIVIVGNVDVQAIKKHFQGVFPVYEVDFKEVPIFRGAIRK